MPLIDPPWLALHPDALIFDATFRLPTENRNAQRDFEQAHIPGARFFDIDRFSDPAEPSLPHMVPSAALAGDLLRELGVRAMAPVVFYDQQGLYSAPRGWFLLRLFGHDDVHVLDGGLPAWRKAGHRVESGVPPAPSRGDFVPRWRAALLRGFGDVYDNFTTGDALVLDARPAARFNGLSPEPRPGVRSGHIPNSRSLPYTELVTPHGTLRSVPELRAIFRRLDALERPVITSCGSGISAAVLTLARAVAGLPVGALYDGSWSEWGSRPEAPIEV